MRDRPAVDTRTCVEAPREERQGQRSIALIDPLGDLGIGIYTYELAEGLAANGHNVAVYSSPGAATGLPLPRHHRLYAVLGSSLVAQRATLREGRGLAATGVSVGAGEDGSDGNRHSSGWAMTRARAQHHVGRLIGRSARNTALMVELAVHLKRRRYDYVWTQWPEMPGFWTVARRLGLRCVHTVHNVLPHEEALEDRARHGAIYRAAHALVVHSTATERELRALYPETAGKIVVAPIGAYTAYPPPDEPRHVTRARLGLRENEVCVLFFGYVRPYKNLDALVAAVADEACSRAVLVIAGREPGQLEDPLASTRRLVRAMGPGLEARTRLVPGPFDMAQTARLFHAADIVALPYGKSYGSAVLMLAVTYGRYVLVTPTGGMDEYLHEYAAGTLAETPAVEALVAGLTAAVSRLPSVTDRDRAIPDRFQWRHVAHTMLSDIERVRGHGSTAEPTGSMAHD